MKKITILFALLFAFVSYSEAQLNIDHFIRVGRTRISIGNYTGAIEYFNIVIQFKPYLPEAYLYRGIAKHSLEDYRGAIEDYDKAIEIKPYYPQAYNNRGMAYHNLRQFKKAIENYSRALDFDKKDETIYNNRGLARLALKDINGAIEDYNKALGINPKSTYALMNLSNARIVKGEIKGAIKEINKIIMIRPHYAVAYLNRGLARFELDNYAAALRDFDLCIRFDPDNALAYNNRGIVKQKLEDYHSAIMDYDMAIKLNPDMASAYFNRAIAREVLKQPGFETDYQIAARLDPKFDFGSRQLDTESLAQQQQQNNNKQDEQQEQEKEGPGRPQSQNAASQRDTTPKNAEQLAQAQDELDKKHKEEIETEKRRRRMRMDLVVEDSRDLPEYDEEVSDGRIQNKNIVIDLQPMFTVSAYEKNSVDYNRFQYYDVSVDKLNIQNNYNPMLAITNKPDASYKSVYENMILFFNEKIDLQQTAHNYLNRGILYSLAGNYDKAFKDLDKAIKFDEKLSIAYFVRATCKYKMKEQIELLEGANSLLPGLNSGDMNDMQIGGASQSEYQEVLDDYAIVLFLNPDFSFGYYNRAVVKLRLGEYRSAVEDLNRAIDLEPEFAEAYFNRGLTKIFLDDIEGGAIDLSRAGELGIEGAYNVIKRYCNL